MVIVFHQLQFLPLVKTTCDHGFDVFFILSGFIMFSLAGKKQVNPSKFLLDRFTRLVPLYWLATILTIAMAGVGLANAAVYDFSYFRAFLSFFFIPSFDKHNQIFPILYLGWSLSFEALFYFIFCISLLLPKEVRLGTITIMLSTLVAAGLILLPSSAIGRSFTSPLLLEFLAGTCLGAILGAELNNASTLITAALAFATCLALSALGLLIPALVPGAFAASILSIFFLIEKMGKLPELRGPLILAEASYSLFIFQQFAFDITHATFVFANRLSGYTPFWLEKASAITAAVVVGLAARRFVEKPLIAWCRRQVVRFTKARVSLAANEVTQPTL